MNRNISKRVELNETEGKVLRMKSEQCGLSESEYIRELIMSSQPAEAPPRQFYERMEILNQVVSQLRQIITMAGETGQEEYFQKFSEMYEKLLESIVEIKEVVFKARFFAPKVYDRWEHEVEMAKKEGRTPPTLEEYRHLMEDKEILHPATDMFLGWNALGIRPPFLPGEDERGNSVKGIQPESEGGWKVVDDTSKSAGIMEGNPEAGRNQTDWVGREKQTDQAEQSIESYAESRILIPPKKEGDP